MWRYDLLVDPVPLAVFFLYIHENICKTYEWQHRLHTRKIKYKSIYTQKKYIHCNARIASSTICRKIKCQKFQSIKKTSQTEVQTIRGNESEWEAKKKLNANVNDRKKHEKLHICVTHTNKLFPCKIFTGKRWRFWIDSCGIFPVFYFQI